MYKEIFTNEKYFLQKKPIDYHDFIGIIILLVVNSTISFIEENNAGNAAAALMARLAPKAKVLLWRNSLKMQPHLLHYQIFHSPCLPKSIMHLGATLLELSTTVLPRSYVMGNGARKMQQCWFLET